MALPKFTLPAWIKQHTFEYDPADLPKQQVERIRYKLKRFNAEKPEVSIVIPAYNEEANILNTLSSLAELELDYPTELFVVNNNSTDRTQEILDTLEIRSYFQPVQGIKHARQMGLEKAKGIYLLQADADSIYPPYWGIDYVEALKDPQVMMVYGRHSVIPSEGTPRFSMGLYEMAAGVLYKIRQRNREYINVLGFNSAFRTKDALEKGSYDHTPQGSEDGHMAMTLMQYGKLKLIPSDRARVWTDDRRLMEAGSFSAAFARRFKREASRLLEYVKGSQLPEDERPKPIH
ncbi:MAG: glycosyltransferase family 2 protein [Bacteroidetes bacterium]|nr:MAG: glycosyltransferase family 2 protein [Bacteroidota bacterium]